MTQRRRLTSSAFIIALVTTFVLPGPVSAADTSEVESLRSEVRQLQAQLQVLRTAVAEATELEGRRSANLARQMRDPGQNAAVRRDAAAHRQRSLLPAPARPGCSGARGRHRGTNRPRQAAPSPAHEPRSRKATKVQRAE